MKKLLVLTATICITLLSLSYTKAKAEENVAGISLLMNYMDMTEVKSAFNKYEWTTDRVNFRNKPSMDSDIIITLAKRTKVRMISSSDKWVKVCWNDTFGYIYGEYLTDKELFTGKNNRWGIDLTDDEIDILSKIVWLESRSEKDIGEFAVIEVVFNRMISMDYSDTLHEVLSDEGQFSTWNDRNNAEPTDREYDNIKKVLNDETNILEFDTVYFSTEPRNDNITAHIGKHYFCGE